MTTNPDWEPMKSRGLGEEVLNIGTCLGTGGLKDREMDIADAYEVGEPHQIGDDH